MSAALWVCAALLGCLICGGAALAEEPGLASLTDREGSAEPTRASTERPATSSAAPGASEAPSAPASVPALVDLNRASMVELTSLPGIGQKRAEAILAYRASHGGFQSVSQLLQIKGIGRAMLRKLRLLVTISSSQGAARDARVAQGEVKGGTPPPHRVR